LQEIVTTSRETLELEQALMGIVVAARVGAHQC
jgi:hypothetical protein